MRVKSGPPSPIAPPDVSETGRTAASETGRTAASETGRTAASETRRTAASETRRTAAGTERASPARLEGPPAAPSPDALPRRSAPAHPSLLGATWGAVRPVAAAAVLGALAFSQAAVGAELPVAAASRDEAPIVEVLEVRPSPAAPASTEVTPETERAMGVDVIRGERLERYDALLERLERLRDEGRITSSELLAARRALWTRMVVEGDEAGLPKLPSGRIDLVALARGEPGAPTRGQEVMERLANDLERRMRVTARDVARGYEEVPGAPGYKQLEPEVVRRLALDALEQIPLGELPIGDAVEGLVRQLPNTGHIDVQSSSLEELLDAVSDAQEDWLKAELEPLLEGRELEAGIVAFGAVTGLRWASPEAARVLDDLGPRLTIYRESERFDGGRGRADLSARLTYRDAEVLPQLDVEAGARHHFAEGWTARADLRGSLSIEGEAGRHAAGTATVGLGYQTERGFVDGALQKRFGGDQDDLRLTVRAAMDRPEAGGHVGLRAYATLKDAEAFGRSEGRWGAEIDATRPVRWRGSEGELGAFTGFSGDLSGGSPEVSAGLVFRLRF